MFISKNVLAATDVSARRGRGPGAADARRDGPALATVSDGGGAGARVGFIYVPHGVILDQFTPKTEGRRLRLPADHEAARAVPRAAHGRQQPVGPPDGGSGHVGARRELAVGHQREEDRSRRCAARHDARSAHRAEVSDSETLFPSLELATEDISGLIGSCDYGFSCTYLNTICWSTPTTPLPMEINPRVRVRADVRRRDSRRSGAGAHAGGSQHPRFDYAGAAAAGRGPRRRRSLRAQRLPRQRPRDRAPDPVGGNAGGDRP